MRQVTIHAAKTHLSRLIEAALGGEEIIIAKGSRPVVRLVAVRQQPFQVGVLAGQLGEEPDAGEVVLANRHRRNTACMALLDEWRHCPRCGATLHHVVAAA